MAVAAGNTILNLRIQFNNSELMRRPRHLLKTNELGVLDDAGQEAVIGGFPLSTAAPFNNLGRNDISFQLFNNGNRGTSTTLPVLFVDHSQANLHTSLRTSFRAMLMIACNRIMAVNASDIRINKVNDGDSIYFAALSLGYRVPDFALNNMDQNIVFGDNNEVVDNQDSFVNLLIAATYIVFQSLKTKGDIARDKTIDWRAFSNGLRDPDITGKNGNNFVDNFILEKYQTQINIHFSKILKNDDAQFLAFIRNRKRFDPLQPLLVNTFLWDTPIQFNPINRPVTPDVREFDGSIYDTRLRDMQNLIKYKINELQSFTEFMQSKRVELPTSPRSRIVEIMQEYLKKRRQFYRQYGDVFLRDLWFGDLGGIIDGTKVPAARRIQAFRRMGAERLNTFLGDDAYPGVAQYPRRAIVNTIADNVTRANGIDNDDKVKLLSIGFTQAEIDAANTASTSVAGGVGADDRATAAFKTSLGYADGANLALVRVPAIPRAPADAVAGIADQDGFVEEFQDKVNQFDRCLPVTTEGSNLILRIFQLYSKQTMWGRNILIPDYIIKKNFEDFGKLQTLVRAHLIYRIGNPQLVINNNDILNQASTERDFLNSLLQAYNRVSLSYNTEAANIIGRAGAELPNSVGKRNDDLRIIVGNLGDIMNKQITEEFANNRAIVDSKKFNLRGDYRSRDAAGADSDNRTLANQVIYLKTQHTVPGAPANNSVLQLQFDFNRFVKNLPDIRLYERSRNLYYGRVTEDLDTVLLIQQVQAALSQLLPYQAYLTQLATDPKQGGNIALATQVNVELTDQINQLRVLRSQLYEKTPADRRAAVRNRDPAFSPIAYTPIDGKVKKELKKKIEEPRDVTANKENLLKLDIETIKTDNPGNTVKDLKRYNKLLRNSGVNDFSAEDTARLRNIFSQAKITAMILKIKTDIRNIFNNDDIKRDLANLLTSIKNQRKLNLNNLNTRNIDQYPKLYRFANNNKFEPTDVNEAARQARGRLRGMNANNLTNFVVAVDRARNNLKNWRDNLKNSVWAELNDADKDAIRGVFNEANVTAMIARIRGDNAARTNPQVKTNLANLLNELGKNPIAIRYNFGNIHPAGANQIVTYDRNRPNKYQAA